MQRKIDKADRAAEGESENIDALIRGDDLNKQAQMLDTDSDEIVDDQDSVIKDSDLDNDNDELNDDQSLSKT